MRDKMKYIFFIICSVLSHTSLGQDYSEYQSLLSLCVNADGKVDYKKLIKEKARLNLVTQSLAEFDESKIAGRMEKLAFWINVYNAFTLKLIVDHYPVNSIQDIDKGKTWDVRRIKMGKSEYSLNQIENEIIRPSYNDVRVHFALNCAAASCPPLLNKAFTGNNLNGLLDQQTKAFVSNEFISYDGKKIRISKIFEWYKNDFGNIIEFLSKYTNTKLNQDTIIEYKDYDWKLNER